MTAAKRTATSKIAGSVVLALGVVGLGLIASALPVSAAPDTYAAAHGSGSNNGWNNANWNNNWNNGWNNGQGPNSWHNQQPQVDTITIDIDRYVSSETLPLRQLGGIGPAYNGRTLRSVVVDLNPWGPQAQVQLLVNGQVVDARATGGKQSVELHPGQSDVFGQEIQTLQLRTVGYASIDDIEINIQRPNGGGGWNNGPGAGWQPQPNCTTLERTLNTQVRFSQIDLNNLFDLGRYNGCRIGSVSFVASTAAGFGNAALNVNGVEASSRQQVATNQGLYTLAFWNRPATGANAPQVALNLMGQFAVQSIRLNLVRN